MPSSPPLRFPDLRGSRVGLWGLGVEGRASLARLDALGVHPVLVDDQGEKAARGLGATRGPGPGTGTVPVLRPCEGGIDALASCEVVVKSPGISRYRAEIVALEQAGVAVVGGLGMFVEEADKDHLLLVTGTKGKSTTAAVIAHLLNGLGEPARAGGNLGQVPYDPGLAGPTPRWWVLEISSYQATDLWSSPRVVVVTSLSPDHLDWHAGSEERYYADKLRICRLPGALTTVANGADERLRARSNELGPLLDWVGPEQVEGARWAAALRLPGAHNQINAALARHALLAAGVTLAADDEAIGRAAAGFRALPSRLELVGSCDGVDFVDDGLATNVLPTMAALDTFADRRIALVAGGFDRGIDYGPLGEHLVARGPATLVLGVPDCGARILEAVSAAARARGARTPSASPGGPVVAARARGAPTPSATAGGPVVAVELEESAGVFEAARRGFEWARPCGVVLLSPAAPSFGRFHDYRERSELFRAAAASCGAVPT